jgi:DNA ligase 1
MQWISLRFLIRLPLLWVAFLAPLHAAPPALMLANKYHDDIYLPDYWVSEKLDGVRAYWDGKNLISRGGYPIAAPNWYIESFPEPPMDGELWMGRGLFEPTSAAVRRNPPRDHEWQQISYMVFDLPSAPGIFDQRLQQLRVLIDATAVPHLRLVEQIRIIDQQALMRQLEKLVSAGAEGLMLHHANAPYRGYRSDDLLKVKLYEDAEARVIGYRPGKGKYRGLTGSLWVENEQGLRFYLGSGLSDADRSHPPPIGSLITFKYHGLTSNGIPRFASYLRRRITE